jgi:hypothetical protein
MLLLLVGGPAMWLAVKFYNVTPEVSRHYYIAPSMYRLAALLILPLLWPGGLWSTLGPQRKPEEYAPFIERAIYWLILLDLGFVLDGLWIGNYLLSRP